MTSTRTEVEAAVLGIQQRSQFGDIRRRFLRNKVAVAGLALVGAVTAVAVLAPLLAPADPYHQDLTNTQAPPFSPGHLLGTDEIGRDLLSRVIYGARVAILVGVASILLAVLVGVLLGAVAGYLGRAWDTAVMRVADVFLAFPLLVGAIIIVLLLGRGVPSVILALGVFGWAVPARLLRSSILSVREREYVLAARSLGASRWRVVTRHVLPNTLAPVLVYAAASVGWAVVTEGALSFLGVGIDIRTPDWGNMIQAGRQFFGYKDYLWLCPSLAIVVTVVGFVFVADGLRDALDPRLVRR